MTRRKTPSPLNDRYLVEIVHPWNIHIYTHRARKRFKQIFSRVKLINRWNLNTLLRGEYE